MSKTEDTNDTKVPGVMEGARVIQENDVFLIEAKLLATVVEVLSTNVNFKQGGYLVPLLSSLDKVGEKVEG